MTTRLAKYLRASRRRVLPGEFDCLLWLADWIVLCGHPDPAEPWRGRYRTWGQASQIVEAAGGLAALARDEAQRIALPEIDPAAAVAGDVGVGAPEGEDVLCGLIKAGDLWAAPQGRFGVVIGPAELAAAWRVPDLAN